MVTFENVHTMCAWERKKGRFLVQVARDLGMDIKGYGELAVNQSTGHTYLWLEDYNFTLYMPIHCELEKSHVCAIWSNSDDGEETEIELNEDTTLQDLEKWAESLEKNNDGN